ncbi:hypothetical protein EON65_07850 [archaeon]|nr:MAG: hypothetical protein EON65_07850 [archaeon]
MENSDSFELVYLDPVSLQEGLTFSKLKRRQVKEEANVRSQKHEQRRRKFMRYQDTHQQKLAKEYFNNEVVGQILNKAVCEKKEDELRDIVLSYKNIFPQNRKNRQLQINLLEQSDRNFLNSWDKIETNREMSWTLYLDTSSQNARRTRLTDAGKYAQRQENQTMVREFLSELIDSALWIATCREIGGFQFDISNQDAADLNLQLLPRNAAKQADDIIPTLVLEDAKSLLISPLPSAPALPNLQSALVSSMLLPFNISERPKVADKDWLLHTLFSGAFVFGDLKEGSASQYAAYLAKDSWSKYVEQVNEGSVNQQLIVQPPSSNSNNTIKLGQSELIALNRKVTASRDAVLAPDWLFTYPPYHILGEVVVQVRCTLKPLPPQPDAHITTNHIPFRGALFGISDVYKQKTVDAFVSTIPRITIIRVESEVAELIRQYTAGELATDDPIHALAKQLSGHLLKGTVIPDSVYVKLIVRRVNSLPAHNNGYLLADYPQSLEQLLLLMEAFSAVRFDQHRPQPSDYASSFAPHVLQHWTYDVAKCGLDMLLSLDSPEVAVSIAMEQRINARKDLVTQEVVYIGPHTKSFKTLQKLYDPTRPEHTAALHIASAEENINQIAEFCKFHGLYDCVKGDESIDSKVQEIARKYIPLERLSAEYWTDYDEQLEIEARAAAELAAAVESSEYHAMLVDAVSDEVVQEQVFLVADEAFTEEQLAQVLQDGDEGAAAAPSVVEAELQLAAESTTEPAPLKESEPPRPPLIEINKLHPLLAGALNELWEATEQQCNSSGESFYFSMRDVRFQMLQRRRMAIDSTNGCMMRLDDRQDLFNQFRTDFNAVDDEMRFDPDCIAELHLKTLRLRNDLCKLCETRKQEMLELITTISTDNNMKVLQHRCYCEGAFFLQAEYNRFYIILQMMFDFGKYIQGYELHEKIMNELEDLLPITMEGYTPVAPPPKPGAVVNPKDAKKEKDKKGKDAANPLAPNRELLAPNVLPVSMMLQSIPTARTHEDPPPDAKAGKGKGKVSLSTVGCCVVAWALITILFTVLVYKCLQSVLL